MILQKAECKVEFENRTGWPVTVEEVLVQENGRVASVRFIVRRFNFRGGDHLANVVLPREVKEYNG